jgi:hypothetical protein
MSPREPGEVLIEWLHALLDLGQIPPLLFIVTVGVLLLPHMFKGLEEAIQAILAAVILAILIAIAVLVGLSLLVSGILICCFAWKASRDSSAEEC